MLLQIEQAHYLGDHRFELRFNDGRFGTVDVRTLADQGPGTVFAQLRNEAFVRRFELKYGTLCWPGELDVAPEYVYFLAFRHDPALHERFVDWGYVAETVGERRSR